MGSSQLTSSYQCIIAGQHRGRTFVLSPLSRSRKLILSPKNTVLRVQWPESVLWSKWCLSTLCTRNFTVEWFNTERLIALSQPLSMSKSKAPRRFVPPIQFHGWKHYSTKARSSLIWNFRPAPFPCQHHEEEVASCSCEREAWLTLKYSTL